MSLAQSERPRQEELTDTQKLADGIVRLRSLRQSRDPNRVTMASHLWCVYSEIGGILHLCKSRSEALRCLNEADFLDEYYPVFVIPFQDAVEIRREKRQRQPAASLQRETY